MTIDSSILSLLDIYNGPWTVIKPGATSRDDTLTGTAGNDDIRGAEGNDTLSGGAGNDRLFGGAGTDTLNGGAGQDQLYGLAGVDTINGGDGNDYIEGGEGVDILNGGAGMGDTLGYTDRGHASDGKTEGGVVVTLQANGGATVVSTFDHGLVIDKVVAGFESVVGSNYGDTIIGNDGDNKLFGLNGQDEIRGGAGNDRIDGGGGDDWLYGDAGNDTINGGDGDDVIFGLNVFDASAAPGNNILNGGAGNDFIEGGPGNDTITGGAGVDGLYGGDGADRFVFTDADIPAGSDYALDLESAGGTFLLDFSAIDANTNIAGNQAFHWVSALTGAAGEIHRIDYQPEPGEVLTAKDMYAGIEIDVNGGGADYTLYGSVGYTDFVL